MLNAIQFKSDSQQWSRHLSLTSLQLFVVVCETGSIGQAAEREFIAASAVSKRLSDLEAMAGVSLLQRHSRGVKPTAAGNRLLHHARSILFDIQRLQADLHEYIEGVRGHVRIYANLSAIVQFLPEDLGSFARKQPNIKIDLQEQISSAILNAIHNGEAELGICYASGDIPKHLEAQLYQSDRLFLVLNEQHPLIQQKHTEIAFEDALDFDFVGLHSASSIGLLMRQAAAASGKSLCQRIQVNGLDTMCRMIDNGLGIGVMPNRAFTLMQRLGNLTAIPIANAWARRQSWLVARDFNGLSPSARLLVAHLQQSVQQRDQLNKAFTNLVNNNLEAH